MTGYIAGRHGKRIEYGTSHPVVCINDRCGYAVEKPEIIAQLQDNNLSGLMDLFDKDKNKGISGVNLQLMRQEIDEKRLLPKLTERVKNETEFAISLDTRDVETLEMCLQICDQPRTMCNVVNGEDSNLRTMLPLMAKYDCVIGTALVDEKGIPMTVSERVRVAAKIADAAEAHGISKENVLIDACCLPASVSPGSVLLTLESMRAIQEVVGTPILLGLSNIGYLMPNPGYLETVYYILTAGHGLAAAMVDPAMPGFQWAQAVLDGFLNADPFFKEYLALYREESKAEGGKV